MDHKYEIDPKNPRIVLLDDGRVALIVERAQQSPEGIVATKMRGFRTKPKGPNMSRGLALRVMERLVRGETPEQLEKLTPWSLYTLRNLAKGRGKNITPADLEMVRERVRERVRAAPAPTAG